MVEKNEAFPALDGDIDAYDSYQFNGGLLGDSPPPAADSSSIAATAARSKTLFQTAAQRRTRSRTKAALEEKPTFYYQDEADDDDDDISVDETHHDTMEIPTKKMKTNNGAGCPAKKSTKSQLSVTAKNVDNNVMRDAGEPTNQSRNTHPKKKCRKHSNVTMQSAYAKKMSRPKQRTANKPAATAFTKSSLINSVTFSDSKNISVNDDDIDDINDCSDIPARLRDNVWITAQQAVGRAEYHNLPQHARRPVVLDYFNKRLERIRSTAPADTSLADLQKIAWRECMRYFFRQRAWPSCTVAHYMNKYIKTGQTERRKTTSKIMGCPRKHPREEIIRDLRERLAAAGGDINQMGGYSQFAREYGVSKMFIGHILREDPELKDGVAEWRHANDLHFECKRSLIAAKFIEFRGDYRERRNACVRHFWKKPGFSQMFVLASCNKFIRYGSVWSKDRIRATEWEAESMNIPPQVMPLHASEEKFLDALNEMQTNLELDGGARRPVTDILSGTTTTTLSSTSISNMPMNNGVSNRHREKRNEDAGTVQTLRSELDATKRALADAQREIQLLRRDHRQQEN